MRHPSKPRIAKKKDGRWSMAYDGRNYAVSADSLKDAVFYFLNGKVNIRIHKEGFLLIDESNKQVIVLTSKLTKEDLYNEIHH